MIIAILKITIISKPTPPTVPVAENDLMVCPAIEART